jgi:hypothetical protein
VEVLGKLLRRVRPTIVSAWNLTTLTTVDRPTLGERFEAWRQRNVLLVTFLFAAVVVSAIVTLATAGLHAYRWAFERQSWQSRETRVIQSLDPGFSLEVFQQRLGAPLFVRRKGAPSLSAPTRDAVTGCRQSARARRCSYSL